MSKRIQILLVDDHKIVRQGVRMILQGESGFDVVGEASNTEEAVAQTNALKPDVVVMDLNLESTDGIETSRQILSALPETKIVVLSAETSTDTVNRALKSGVLGYVVKESASDELIRAIQTVLSGRFYLCPEITTAMIKSQSLKSTPEPAALTDRERELIRLIAEGRRNKEIADLLQLSIKSVEANRSKLMTKLNCTSAAELVRYAIREGIAKL